MAESWWGVVLAVLASYLLGSVPTGYWVGRLRGVDIRTQGSGNMGATNVVRVLGWPTGVFVLLVDVAKGALAVFLLARFTAWPASELVRVGCGLAAVLGHTFTLFLGFKGGKGVATSCGVFLALAPLATALVLLVFVVVVALTRYVSLGSICAAALLPAAIWVAGESGRDSVILIVSVFLAAAVIFLHRANIGRLRQGTEHRLGAPKTQGGRP